MMKGLDPEIIVSLDNNGPVLRVSDLAALVDDSLSEAKSKPVSLDAAWRQAEKALPQGWKPYLSVWYDARDPGWRAAAAPDMITRPTPLIGKGSSPETALQALTALLRERARTEH